jgi:hypothetical protein
MYGVIQRENRERTGWEKERKEKKRTAVSQSLALRADVRVTRRALGVMNVRIFVAKDASRTTRKGAVKDGLSIEELAEVLEEGQRD